MELLQNVMQTICTLANDCLNNLDPRPDDWVVLTSMVDHDGTLNQQARDKVVLMLYNITREPFASSYRPALPAQPGVPMQSALAVKSPPLYLDLHVMFMANFAEKSYGDGLAALSRVIGFFQQTPVVTPQNAPMLSPTVDQLTLDFENLSPVDVNYVMSMLGTRYFPSAFYQVRMLPFDADAMISRTYAVSGSGLGSTPRPGVDA